MATVAQQDKLVLVGDRCIKSKELRVAAKVSTTASV